MLHALINFLFNRKGRPDQHNTVAETAPVAPYKLEPPVVTPIMVPPEGASGTDWPFPKPAEKPAAKKPRAKKVAEAKAPEATTPKKPRAKKAK